MNVYDDYGSYIEQYSFLIENVKEHCPLLDKLLKPVIKVLDYIYEQYLAKDLIAPELDDIFDLGFGYFSNIIESLHSLYLNEFNSDFNEFNKYSSLIYYSLYLEDLKCYLIEENEYSSERKVCISSLEDKINKMITSKVKIDNNTIKSLDEELFEVIPPSFEFQSTSYVFYRMTEELELY